MKNNMTSNGRFQVMNVEYENSGGGCMVLVATVYDSLVNNIRYVLYNEEGGSFTTVDYVFSDIDYDDRMLIAYYNEEEHEAYISASGKSESSDLNELFEYCWLEFIKRDCKHWKHTLCAEVERIPLALTELIPSGYTAWLKENGQLVETDGERIIVDDRFKPSAKENKYRSQEHEDLVKLSEHMSMEYSSDTDEDWEKFYSQKIVLGFGSKMVVLDNTAAAYDGLAMCIREILLEDFSDEC